MAKICFSMPRFGSFQIANGWPPYCEPGSDPISAANMSVSNDKIPTNLLILDSKNYDKWYKQRKVLFGYQDVLDMITNDITPLGEEATTVQQAKFKEDKKKDYKALFLIHSCVDSDNFEKVGDCDSAKTAWGILEKAYAGADKAKVVRKGEGSSKGGGQDNYKSFDKSTKKCYNCQKLGHFARECRAKPRENYADEAKVARQDVDYDNTVLVMIMEENYDIKEVLDNNCDKRKLFDNNYCSAEKTAKTHSEKSAMVTVQDGVQGRNEWYLDSGCSTHMTGRKDWFVKINQATRSRVKFADDTTLATDGVGDVLIMRRDGGHSLIKDVLYIPGIKCNLLSIGQLLERNYMIRMENKVLRVLDQNGILILKAPMAANRTFKIELEIIEHRCLATAASRDE
ncbi:uncharacterized protein [Cicer arietinum]|uniref:uncharacterized protein n=1 Tax=Cicer arietinum TaxID=3827 RepID=UPI003CC5C758